MSDPKGEAVDMSPAAIARRLRDVSDVLELCLSLQKAKFLGYARDLEAKAAGDENPEK